MAQNNDEIDLKDKVVIVTGANTGIGFSTALDLAKRGAFVTLACRDRTRATVACEQIKKETNNNNVFVEDLDLSDLSSVRNFAKTFISKSKRLDILINNAGVFLSERRLTKDGFEMHFGVNHLGHFLLTNLLLDLLKKSAPSRIINVSSGLYKNGTIRWDDLNFDKNFDSFKAYGQSKLANILFAKELANRLKETGVTAVSLHPGVVDTEISRDFNNCTGCLFRCFGKCFAKTPIQGAQTTIYCATNNKIPVLSGQYFSDSKPEKLVERLTNEEDARRLWEISSKLVNL